MSETETNSIAFLMNSKNSGKQIKKYEKRETVFQTENKQLSLQSIIEKETMKLLNNQGRSDSMIIKNPTNYVDVIDQTEVPIENKYQIEPLYSWVHLACTLSVPDIFFTPKSPLKVSLESWRWEKTCEICKVKGGVVITCPIKSCEFYAHGECARRADYSIIDG